MDLTMVGLVKNHTLDIVLLHYLACEVGYFVEEKDDAGLGGF